jgi:spectinomycin phosphotransferase
MKVEPTIDRAAVLAALRDQYGLSAATINFVPEGEVGVGYAFAAADGARYFAKLWPPSRIGRLQQARLPYNLPITRELSDRGFVRNLIGPLPTVTGQLYVRLGDAYLALFPYINGQPLSWDRSTLSSAVTAQIAVTMARLHAATWELRSPLPPQPAFTVSFGAELRTGLAALAAVGPSSRPGLVRLRDLLLPRRDDLLAQLAQVERMADDVECGVRQLVLCHTDMGGNNVLVDDAGAMWVLDWDDLVVAPPEHDLHQYTGPGFVEFLRIYWQAGGVRALSAPQFAFYLLRRYLGDLTDWLMRILHENTDAAEDEPDLAGITGYCLPQLDGFAADQAAIARDLQLAERLAAAG